MRYTRKRTGDFLILVHGALADERMWFTHMDNLSQSYDVISISLRHFDDSNEGGFGLNTHAADLADFINVLAEEKKVNIAAWSYGADVVLNMLVGNNIPLENIFLYEPGYPGCLSEEELVEWKKDSDKMFEPVFDKFIEGNLEDAVEALIDGSGNKEGYFLRQTEEIRHQQLEKAHTLNMQLNQVESPKISERGISGITLPFIVGFGSKTRDLFRLVSRKTVSLACNASYKVIEGEGHMLPMENPKKFSMILIENLKTS